MIRIKRVYDSAERNDGSRFLVDHLWPRGLKKEAVPMASWVKEVSPSDALRKWFGHDPAKWEEFQRRYFAELNDHPEAWEPLLQAGQQGDMTLLFSARDTEHNNAAALKAYLEEKQKTRQRGKHRAHSASEKEEE